jgi:hypothetical protein
MPMEHCLSNPHRLGEIIIRQRWIENFVTMFDQERWFTATRYRIPAMQEQNFHW